MRIPFAKMHGAGNDFVLVDARGGKIPAGSALAARLGPRPDGIGCEGVIFLVEPSSPECDFRMLFFNPDGSEAAMCGNGARCVAAFARAVGAAKADTMEFETGAGRVRAEILSAERVRISMPPPRSMDGDFIDTGVPHRIVPVADVAAADVAAAGRRIRFSPEYAPDGTNVDFAQYEPPGRVRVRTYERGVEAETGACGTGAVAAAAVGVARHGLRFPVAVETTSGCELEVGGVFDGKGFSCVTLSGPVRFLFTGVFPAAS